VESPLSGGLMDDGLSLEGLVRGKLNSAAVLGKAKLMSGRVVSDSKGC
jgi:hypothetical protein